jgi:hypothetical protein
MFSAPRANVFTDGLCIKKARWRMGFMHLGRGVAGGSARVASSWMNYVFKTAMLLRFSTYCRVTVLTVLTKVRREAPDMAQLLRLRVVIVQGISDPSEAQVAYEQDSLEIYWSRSQAVVAPPLP